MYEDVAKNTSLEMEIRESRKAVRISDPDWRGYRG
jgi:hypothetical protein